MSRKIARVETFKIVYQLEFQKEEYDLIYNEAVNDKIQEKPVLEYIDKVTKGVKEHNDELEKIIIQDLKKGWNLSRISKVNIAILKIAIYELIYMKEEIPHKVSINEALELVDLFGEPGDKSFINGILANVLKDNT